MTTNSYFESSWNELDNEVFADLVQESIQIHGRDYYYLPRELTDLNLLLGEDNTSSNFNHAIKIEMYLENVISWGGENSFISKFGIEQHDESVLCVDKRRFAELITSEIPDIKMPRCGDLIVFPKEIDRRKRIFEINYVNPEPVFYQLGRLYYYQITVRVFNHTHEHFATEIPEIDNKMNHENLLTHTIQLDYERTLNASITGNIEPFEVGEEVIHHDNFSSIVVMHDTNSNKLTLSYNNNLHNTGEDGEFSMLDVRSSSVTKYPLISVENPDKQWYILPDKKKGSRQRKKSSADKHHDGLSNEVITDKNDLLIHCDGNALFE